MKTATRLALFAWLAVLSGTQLWAGSKVAGIVKHSSVRRATTVVYIEKAEGIKIKVPEKNAVMDQKGKDFVPQVLPVMIGTTVDFLNSDSFEHNVFSPDGEKYDLGRWSEGEARSYTFKRPGVYTQLCKVHPEMIGYVVVLESPYFAIADEKGNFVLNDVPDGNYSIKVWNERLRPQQLEKSFPVSVKGKEIQLDVNF